MSSMSLIYLFSGFVLSSTNLYLDNCLYARNTINAIIRKSIMLEIKSPYLNSVMEPDRFVTLTDMFSKLPAGKKKPTIGSIISVTNAVTSLDAAAPITNAIANPIIPNTLRKSKNSWDNDFFTTAGGGVPSVGGEESLFTAITV